MYTSFAYIYDKLMYDVDYTVWANYIEEIIKRNNISGNTILDLGCGTGNLTTELARRGYELIGIDISTDMLMCAKEKALNEKLDILYLNQDMSDFELYGTVDIIICMMDSLNYLTDKKSLKRLFKLVANYLNPGGLFIFDINTQYKLEKVLGNNVFYDVGEEISYIWSNSFDKRKRICEFDLTFFVKEDSNYIRHDELHCERAYADGEIKVLIEQSGLRLLNLYDELSFSKPIKNSKRNFYVCKK